MARSSRDHLGDGVDHPVHVGLSVVAAEAETHRAMGPLVVAADAA